jgi:hypothetical protein
MRTVRLRLCVFATIWLLFQTAQFSAFIPRDCCLKHRPGAASEPASCHHPAPPANCSFSNGCAGPLASLMVLLSNQGILPEAAAVVEHMIPTTVPDSSDDGTGSLLERPDPPPPRL